ncbi:MAG: hypothetical protein BWZ06_01279 [Bacteroidetes bacterium ADurb.BinA261]|nr:MAG: hypothetical protein BWZ06_01279 [Bacteroidetes bacterium ADurb.BinA261]
MVHQCRKLITYKIFGVFFILVFICPACRDNYHPESGPLIVIPFNVASAQDRFDDGFGAASFVFVEAVVQYFLPFVAVDDKGFVQSGQYATIYIYIPIFQRFSHAFDFLFQSLLGIVTNKPSVLRKSIKYNAVAF